jgi:hypothetical protein
VFLRLRLLEDRRVDPKVTATQDLENLVSDRLGVFGCVEDLVQVNPAPAKVATELKQLITDPTVIRGDRVQDEIATGPGSSGEVKVSRLVGEDVPVGHRRR